MPSKISIDFILFFLLTISFLTGFYHGLHLKFIWLHFLFFIIFTAYIFLDYFILKDNNKKNLIKVVILSLSVSILVLFSGGLLIAERYSLEKSAENYEENIAKFVHDNPLQIEAAVKFLLQGKNPYQEEYFNTPHGAWMKGEVITMNGQTMVNPALYHVVSLPAHILFSVPFYYLFDYFIHWYDQRFVYFLVFLLTIFLILKFKVPVEKKILFIIIFSLNPIFINDFLWGVNDVFILFWIILTFYLLQKNKPLASSLSLAIAVASKHSAWFLVPFYFFYLYFKERGAISDKVKSVIKKTWPFFILVTIVILPFLIWDGGAFLQDILSYPAGTTETSYPINGVSLGTLLFSVGVIEKITDYFPFWIPQLLVGIPFFIYLIKKQRKNNKLYFVMLSYASFIFIFWIFSRFLHLNYLAYTSNLFLLSYFLYENSSE